MKLSQEKYTELVAAARAARGGSYSPFSRFAVGAALLTEDGRIYTGANVENSSYSATVCAERVAIHYAVASGERAFSAIAVVGGAADEELPDECLPCAVCLQVMAEFCCGDFEIVTADSGGKIRVHTLEELLPRRFRL